MNATNDSLTADNSFQTNINVVCHVTSSSSSICLLWDAAVNISDSVT